jgi:hypothetical protein
VNEAVPGRHRHRGAAGLADSAGEPDRGQRGPGPPVSDGSLDEQLVGAIYREHGLSLVRVALLLVGDKATAEDVVQEAFIGLLRGLHPAG